MEAADRNRTVRPNVALGEFLRSRRARLSPQEAGLPFTGRRRRVEGLRREELAELANVSVKYYTRLEQGLHVSASAAVLDAIATALRLSDAERSDLHQLADVASVTDEVRPETARLLHALDPTPAVLLGPGIDVLATNEGLRRLYADFDKLPNRNALHWMLFDPRARELYGADWREATVEMIGMLRLRTDQGLRDARAREVAEELAATSGFFREVWEQSAASTARVRPVKRFQHPEAGPIDMHVERLQVAHAKGQSLVVFVPEPGSPDERMWHSVMARPAHRP